MNLQENIQRIRQMMGIINEGLRDTSWTDEEGNKITLMDLLDATQDIPIKKISVKTLKPYLLTWDGDEEEIKKRLTLEIADKLMKSNFMLFTKEHKPDSDDMIFRARCCISHKNNIKVFLKNGM